MSGRTLGYDWTLVLVLTAFLLSVVVISQILSRHAAAYLAAPRDVAAFLDTIDSSVEENESYDRDVARAPRLEDKIRLGRLLREIQKAGDDLREELNRLLVSEDKGALRTGARLLWATKRPQLEDRVRRMDLLRMRFMVIYMGVITSSTSEKSGVSGSAAPAARERDPEKTPSPDHRRPLPRALSESLIKKQTPSRRLSVQTIGHNDNVVGDHRKGWFGVVQELQRSPRMHQRHASIEMSMARTP